MEEQIFKAILITTLCGTFLTAFITLIKPITKKIFGFNWHYYIWLAVLVVMILPIRFTMPNIEKNVNSDIKNNAVIFNNSQMQAELTNEIVTEKNIQSDEKIANDGLQNLHKSSARKLFQTIQINSGVFALIWLLGMGAVLLINILAYVRLIYKVRRRSVVLSCPEIKKYTNRKIIVCAIDNLSSPFIMGIFKPRLVLPDIELTQEELDNILIHETTHLKRNDILYKWFAVFVKAIHWFNPIIYYVTSKINTECEISCDLAVVKNMNDMQKTSYVNTIIALVSYRKTKAIPLTTGMTGNKNTLKRRFTMIKNKKTTSKLMSLLSALVAVVMLTTTVFASGVLLDLSTDDYRIELIGIDGQIMELTNKPIIYNDLVYVPLREILEAYTDEPYIDWNRGYISIAIFNEQGDCGFYTNSIGYSYIGLKHFQKSEFDEVIRTYHDNETIRMKTKLYGETILINSNTYISLKDINYMMYGFLNKRDPETKHLYEITYKVYDKNRNEITKDLEMQHTIQKENTRMKTSIFDTAELFFKALYYSDIEALKRYCTQDCIDKYITENAVFGMYKASVLKMAKYDKNDNTKLEASIKINDSSEVLDISIYFVYGTDGRYLIDGFGR